MVLKQGPLDTITDMNNAIVAYRVARLHLLYPADTIVLHPNVFISKQCYTNVNLGFPLTANNAKQILRKQYQRSKLHATTISL